MTTTAQEALKTFEDGWITINWGGMNATQKQSHVAQHYGLKIDAAKEIEANRVEAEAQAVIDAEARRQQAITYLTNHGFACDNSLADWQRLYNHPAIFGDNWATQADYQFGLNKGLNYFLQTAYVLWEEYVKNN